MKIMYNVFRCMFHFDDFDSVYFESKSAKGMLYLLSSFELPSDYVFSGYIDGDLFVGDNYSGDSHTDFFYDFDSFIKKLEDLLK